MQIKANSLLKFAVPALLLIGIIVALRSCEQSDTNTDDQASSDSDNETRQLTPAEVKALGLNADTPQDTVATLVGQMHQMKEQLSQSQQESQDLREQNERLAKKDKNVQSRINNALSKQQQIDSRKRDSLVDSLNQKLAQVRDAINIGQSNKDQDTNADQGQMPVGLGLNGEQPAGAQGQRVTWVNPLGAQAAQPGSTSGNGGSSAGGGKNGNAGSAFATSFQSGTQAVSNAGQQAAQSLPGRNGQTPTGIPVYTVPANATLTGSVAMTALLGRVPINGTVQDPYPFKIVIGPSNLTANGIELPELKGAIVSGTATGDWTLSCVRGTVRSITFIFQDGTTRVVPESRDPDEDEDQEDREIGYISNPAGVPCVSGTRKTNARSFILTDLLLSAGAGAANAVAGSETTTSVNGFGVASGVTGNSGRYIAGQAASQGINDVRQWIEKRFGQTFDAVYVPPGQPVAVNIDKTLDIDYEPHGRRVHHVRYQSAQNLD